MQLACVQVATNVARYATAAMYDSGVLASAAAVVGPDRAPRATARAGGAAHARSTVAAVGVGARVVVAVARDLRAGNVQRAVRRIVQGLAADAATGGLVVSLPHVNVRFA